MNLLLISIDSLRLDFVSRTNPRIKTPYFDDLIRNFCFFERFFSTSSATRPVHTSLFTGLFPFEHGLLGQHYPLMRPGIPHLFDLFRQRTRTVGAFSEAREVFEGLSYAPGFEPLSLDANKGLGQITRFLEHPAPTFLFLHYWSVHAPYGASDGRALGETLQLLSSGQLPLVQERYARAVEHLFEGKIAPLLARLDLNKWCVFIVSDHGESWTINEPYHGQTLRNSVLRIPLYYHIPYTGNLLPPRPLLSMVDLFPTFAELFDLDVDYRGFGRDIRKEEKPEYYLAQIDPLAGTDDLGQPHPSELIIGEKKNGRQWAIFDQQRKFTFDEERQEGRLERTLSEESLRDEQATADLKKGFEEMLARSPYAQLPDEEATPAQEDLLEKRLRDLGYLD